MPIGTVSRGRRKISDGVWRPLPKGKVGSYTTTIDGGDLGSVVEYWCEENLCDKVRDILRYHVDGGDESKWVSDPDNKAASVAGIFDRRSGPIRESEVYRGLAGKYALEWLTAKVGDLIPCGAVSTTKNPEKAKMFGDVLLVVRGDNLRGVDLETSMRRNKKDLTGFDAWDVDDIDGFIHEEEVVIRSRFLHVDKIDRSHNIVVVSPRDKE